MSVFKFKAVRDDRIDDGYHNEVYFGHSNWSAPVISFKTQTEIHKVMTKHFYRMAEELETIGYQPGKVTIKMQDNE